MPSLAVWAPTALKDPGVSVNVYDAAGAKLETVPMTLDEATGVWSVTGNADWDRKFYTISLRSTRTRRTRSSRTRSPTRTR